MERVQYQQEQMLTELKDLVKKGLFSQNEIKHIMKKRTAFETALIRRVARKGDFLRYAAYEMTLEALRRKRVERLKLPPAPPTASDYAMVRRQFYIFERALKKFKGDVGLWIQYLQLAKRENARALVGRISARALQLHPNVPALYVFAASHELTHLSPSAARSLLLRGIRLNPESVELWREYVKMELGFIESLRRRWKILGLEMDGSKETPDDTEQQVVDSMDVDGVTAVDPEEALSASKGVELIEEGEATRKEIMSGAIVRTVIDSAVEAIPKLSLFASLQNVLATYPCPAELRRSLLDHLHSLLQASFSTSSEPEAAKLYSTRHLTADIEGGDLVDALQRANEDFLECMRSCSNGMKTGTGDGLARAYISFLEEWLDKDIDDNLKLYLTSSMHALSSSYPSPSLLAADLRLSNKRDGTVSPSYKLRRLARHYTSKAPKSAEVWLARLDLEASLEENDDYTIAWRIGQRAISTDRADEREEILREAVWMHLLDHSPNMPLIQRKNLLGELILESLQYPVLDKLQENLHIRYVRTLCDCMKDEPTRNEYKVGVPDRDIQELARTYLPSPRVWSIAFDLYARFLPEEDRTASTSVRESVLRLIYDKWRLKSPQDHGDAALAWAGWLLRHGKGRDAVDCIASATASLDGEAKSAFERRWREVLDKNDDEDDNEGEVDQATSDAEADV